MAVRRLLHLIVLVLLVGCADPEPVPDDGLSATRDTGILLGVVVDETVVPLAGVAVTISAGSQHVADATTDDAGRFAVGGLEPGLYVLSASLDGFFQREATTVVAAGVQDPDVVKLVLQRDDRTTAFFLQHVWEGKMACATTGANWCALPSLYVGINPAQDNSVRLFWDEFMEPQRVPQHVSIDLAWRSTQTVTPELLQRITATDPDLLALGRWNYTFIDFEGGASPVHFDIDQDAIEESHLGDTMGLSIETFVPTPGAAIDQTFTEFITVFYNYAPPAAWRLTDDPSVPAP